MTKDDEEHDSLPESIHIRKGGRGESWGWLAAAALAFYPSTDFCGGCIPPSPETSSAAAPSAGPPQRIGPIQRTEKELLQEL